MNTILVEETILKTDVVGRGKTPLARREQLLDKFERSGLSGQKFAALVGVKYSTFATWAQKRRRARGAYPVKASGQKTDPVKRLEAVVEAVIDPEPVKQAPRDWRCIGQEVSEQLDYEPAHFLRRKTLCRKYVHRLDLNRAPLTAPLPERSLDRSLPAPGLLAQVLVGKYCDHLPLYRQEQIYAQRHGVQRCVGLRVHFWCCCFMLEE